MSERAAGWTRPTARAVSDPRALRALAHPLRWSLLEVLVSEQTATATRCAELLSEPVNSCSFHLRMLEKYGFIERVESSERREHPWRLVDQQFSWDGADESESAVTNELNEMLIEVEARRQQTYLGTRSKLPAAWRKAASAQGAFRWMTSAELTSMNSEIEAVLDQYRDRNDPARRPPGARLVRLTSVAIPMRQP